MGASHLGKALESACAVAAAVCMAVGLAPFASADDTTADAAQLPDHIVNGDFEYHKDIIADGTWRAVTPATGENFSYSHGWQPGPSDWDESRFGWHSTQNCDDGRECRTGAVEPQQFRRSNTWAEIVAAQADTSIYQDIRVTPGNTYHWSLKHQSVRRANTMQVLIGAPGKEQPQQAKRTKTNGGGDQLGAVGTDITTNNKLAYRESNKGAAENRETYEGDWTCPEGVTVARFTFKSVDSPAPNNGNLVDDIGFSQSTTLRYDPNGGTGAMADQSFTYGTPQALTAATFQRDGYSLTGWNTRPDGTGKSFTDKQTVADLLTHENAVGTLYAQWAPTPPVITVVFHSNDGGTDETVKRVWASNNLDMKAIGLPDGWTKKGFVFHGRNLAADGSGVEYKAGESPYGRMTTATVDLYADWAGLSSTLPQAGGSTKAPAYGAGLALMVLGAGAWLSAGRRRRMA